jgi:hypothetical protein
VLVETTNNPSVALIKGAPDPLATRPIIETSSAEPSLCLSPGLWICTYVGCGTVRGTREVDSRRQLWISRHGSKSSHAPFIQMLSQKSLVVAFGLRFLHAGAQATLDASACLPGSGVSTLPACNYLSSQISYCAGPQVATGAPAIACFCNQKLFNSFFE